MNALPADAANAKEPVASVVRLSKRFPLPKPYPFARRRHVHAVTDVSFELQGGEALGLVGESGSGKTTVALLLVRLILPSAGTVSFRGLDIASLPRPRLKQYRRRVQMVFQDPYASLNPRLTIRDALLEPIIVHGLAPDRAAADRRVSELLDLVGLPRSAGVRYPHEFSGGQRQRIGIARALAVEPEVLVADEPVSALDVSIQAQIIELLDELRRRLSLSILLVSHDLGVVGYMCDRIAVMYLGRIVEIGTAQSIFERPAHPYTRALLAAIPSLSGRPARRRLLGGDLPSPVNPPSGCVFRTRCPYAIAACAHIVPTLEPVSGGSLSACIRNSELEETMSP
jgi:oligopeptide/dipeptide ABC transporter ATP-binding protein